MKGFFYKEEEKKPLKSQGTKAKSPAKTGCEACGLYKDCITPKMKVTGKGKKKILIIAEAPGKTEDEEGIQLVGQAGKILRKVLEKNNIDIEEDCWKTNAVICRPPKNKTPTNKQINCCRPNLKKTIEELKPKKIISLGKIALQSLIEEKISTGKIESWIGWSIPDQEYGCWIFPTYHPSYLLRNDRNKALKNIFAKNIKNAIEYEENIITNTADEVKIIKDPFAATIFLEGLQMFKAIAFDIETTGLKPYREGHKIKTISFAISPYDSTAFPIFYENKEFMKALKNVLTNKNIKKIAHNIKFEQKWIKYIFGYKVKGWYADTMIDTHILNIAAGITSLKFQAYVNFGEAGYDKEISHLLEAENSHAFNRIDEIPIDQLLEYNALDSLYTFKLFNKQLRAFENNKHYKRSSNFFFEGTKALADIEENGIYTNEDYYIKKNLTLNKKIKKLKKTITNDPAIKKVEKITGKTFKSNSSPQMQVLLFDVLGQKSVKKTAKGNASTDLEVLEQIKSPIIKQIVEVRKLTKLKNTYLKNFLIEIENNIMHPNFNLNTVKSFRSSSSNPNFQNVPKRDLKAQKITRQGIIPRPGNFLMEVDYKSIEVCISACYHKDPNMIKYIMDPTTDMHRDVGTQLFLFDKKDLSKELRYLAKNGMVFPEFYGSYYVDCAKNIWKEIPKETKLHLKGNGIKSYQAFEQHVQNIEEDFWGNRFPVYAKWKESTWKEYLETGQIISLTNFIYSGLMDKKQVSNYPIQGSAFHCLLWSLIQINKVLKKKKFNSLIIGQIHDSIVFDVDPNEFEELLEIVHTITCIDLRKHFKWINVPINIEIEKGEINDSWDKLKKYEVAA